MVLHLRAQGLEEGDEHPYALLWNMVDFIFTFLPSVLLLQLFGSVNISLSWLSLQPAEFVRLAEKSILRLFGTFQGITTTTAAAAAAAANKLHTAGNYIVSIYMSVNHMLLSVISSTSTVPCVA